MPFVIVTYDIQDTKVNKVRKILKKYLYWCQNSVFEGEISEVLLTKCRVELKKVTDSNFDSIYFYIVDNPNNIKKEVHGVEKNPVENFL